MPNPHRWTSRKFLLSVSTQLAALAVLFWPNHEAAIVEASQSVAALLVLVLSSLGYLKAEASIDSAAAGSGDPHKPS